MLENENVNVRAGKNNSKSYEMQREVGLSIYYKDVC